MGLLTLLTDFGTADWYVAAVKGTVLRLAAGAHQLIDLSHQVPPGDVETAAFLLTAAAPCFPAGTIHLAVVDPGVGSERRLLAVATGGPREALFLAPDNGLLTPFFAGAAVRSIERPDLYQSAPGRTFHGRDRFAPVAAALLSGLPFTTLGPEVDDPLTLPAAPPRREADRLTGRVLHVDRFGNLVTDIPAAWLPEGLSVPFSAEVAGHRATLRAACYSELPAGVPGVLTGSLGTLELSLDGGDLARAWQVGRGAPVQVRLGPTASP